MIFLLIDDNAMRRLYSFATLSSSCLLCACITKGPNPADPYESINRKTHQFNMAFDATVLKPLAKLYKAIIPTPIRTGIDNAYNNVNMLPTMANDILQGEWNYLAKDAGRFAINSTYGLGGIIDVAAQNSLPPHSNDLGLTFAKWGDKNSPYIVIPFLGPSTIRDGMGMMFDYAFFTPYPYIHNDKIFYSLMGLRYIDLRAQMLETDPLIAEAMDQYTFIRDAYLQHRQYLLNGGQQANATNSSTGANTDASESLYVDGDDETTPESKSTTPKEKPKASPFPLTTASNAPHSPPSA